MWYTLSLPLICVCNLIIYNYKTYTYIHNQYVYIFIYLFMSVCVCETTRRKTHFFPASQHRTRNPKIIPKPAAKKNIAMYKYILNTQRDCGLSARKIRSLIAEKLESLSAHKLYTDLILKPLESIRWMRKSSVTQHPTIALARLTALSSSMSAASCSSNSASTWAPQGSQIGWPWVPSNNGSWLRQVER